MEELLRSIGITRKGEYNNRGAYIIDIENSDEMGKIYSLLEKSNELEMVESSHLLTVDNASIEYDSEDYRIYFIADWKNDEYKIVVEENK